jgi:type I restriction enzyme S subunit
MKSQKENVLSLRFAEFQDEWIERRLEDVCIRIMDGTHFSPQSKEGPRKYVTSRNIRNDGLDLSNLQYISEEEHQGIFARTPVQFGDILLTKDGASTGNVCLNTLKEEFSLLSSVAALRNNESTSNLFLLQSLQSSYGQRAIRNAIAGQAITRITLEIIKSLKLRFPTLLEQQKIAAFLSAVDERIGQLARKKELLLKYKKGAMHEIFSQKIRFKDANGNDFPDWETRPFSDLFISLPTKNFQILASEFASEGRYPVIDQGQSDVAGFSDNAGKLFKDTPVVVFGDHTASVKYIDFDFVVGADGTKILKPVGGDAKFLYYALIRNNVSTEGYKRHFSILKSIDLLIPKSKDEQANISNFLSVIDKKIISLDHQLKKSKTFKKGLLQQMFI